MLSVRLARYLIAKLVSKAMEIVDRRDGQTILFGCLTAPIIFLSVYIFLVPLLPIILFLLYWDAAIAIIRRQIIVADPLSAPSRQVAVAIELGEVVAGRNREARLANDLCDTLEEAILHGGTSRQAIRQLRSELVKRTENLRALVVQAGELSEEASALEQSRPRGLLAIPWRPWTVGLGSAAALFLLIVYFGGPTFYHYYINNPTVRDWMPHYGITLPESR